MEESFHSTFIGSGSVNPNTLNFRLSCNIPLGWSSPLYCYLCGHHIISYVKYKMLCLFTQTLLLGTSACTVYIFMEKTIYSLNEPSEIFFNRIVSLAKQYLMKFLQASQPLLISKAAPPPAGYREFQDPVLFSCLQIHA